MPPLSLSIHHDSNGGVVSHVSGAQQFPPMSASSSLSMMHQPTPSPISPNGPPPSHNPISPSEPSSSTTTTATWPRRVSKACCSCRRDKIRCDGARPCAGCVRKGLPADKCIDGCLPCRRSRARCDGANPCTRCRDLGVECIDENTASAMRSSLDIPTKTLVQPPRAKTIERAKLACLACRRDNKKCDDQRPCTRCQARQEECIHVNRGPKVVKSRCSACRRDNKKCEDCRPCRFCVEANEPCSDVPRKGRGHGTRVKAACMNCRRDKIQCGNERPCHGCVRRGYECMDRTCQCTEKGPGQECNICRAQKQKVRAQIQDQAPADSLEVHMVTSLNESPISPTHPDTPIHQHPQHQPHRMPLGPPPPPGMIAQAFPMMPPPYPQHHPPHPNIPPGMPVAVSMPAYPPPGGPMALPVPMPENGGYYPVIDPAIDDRNTQAITS